MMATIIDVGNGSFIAGDPDEILGDGYHWCQWCNGSGLDYDIADDLTICGGCCGVGQTVCDDKDCADHARP